MPIIDIQEITLTFRLRRNLGGTSKKAVMLSDFKKFFALMDSVVLTKLPIFVP